MASLVSEVTDQLSLKDKLVKKQAKELAHRNKDSKDMAHAVKASKKHDEQAKTRDRLVKKAKAQYEKNGGQFFTADEMADKFIKQEQGNF